MSLGEYSLVSGHFETAWRKRFPSIRQSPQHFFLLSKNLATLFTNHSNSNDGVHSHTSMYMSGKQSKWLPGSRHPWESCYSKTRVYRKICHYAPRNEVHILNGAEMRKKRIKMKAGVTNETPGLMGESSLCRLSESSLIGATSTVDDRVIN